MTRISRQLKTDKRTKRNIKADVHKTKIYLTIDNLTIKLSQIEAKRMALTLTKAVAIQETR